MELTLTRNKLSKVSTIGQLEDEDEFLAYTLEDVVRPKGVKVLGKTAIAPGRYQVVITHSNRFKVMMPLLVNVPNCEGVRIHPGNTAEDTTSCILVGQSKGTDAIYESKKAYKLVFDKIQAAINKKYKVYITIK